MFQDAVTSYREALRHWVPLFCVHLFVRLLSLAVLVPVIGVLLAVTLSFSDQSALTDQDIARFLLTPAGAVGALAVGALVVTAAVVDVAVMAAVLRSRSTGIVASLGTSLWFLQAVLPRLLRFAGGVILRVLLLALPFVAVAGAAAAFLLRDYDINFYLANRPREFLIAVGIGGLCLAALALLLLERLSAWAVALHLCLFDRVPTRHSFRESRRLMTGHRRALLGCLLAWIALRFVAASLLATVAGFLLAEGPPLFEARLPLFFAATALLIGLWSAANALLNALANGALADILNDAFNRGLQGRPARAEVQTPRRLSRLILAPLALGGAALGTLALGGFLSNEVGGVEDVQVIAHRGAAGSRPENTLASVVKALEDGADWVEIDVQETADGEVLVVHDSDFMKAARNPVKVWNVTMEEVARIDIGSWFDPIYADERAPLLRDVLQTVRGRAKLLIELKYYGHDVDLENRVAALVEAAGMEHEIATMSLKYPAVQKMRALRPDWRTGVLAATSVGNLAGLEGDFIAVNAARVSGRTIARAEAAGKDVYVWTVNDAASMSRMISLGVNGLITDEPKLAREVIAFYETLSTPQRVMLRIGDLVGFAFDVTPEEGGEI